MEFITKIREYGYRQLQEDLEQMLTCFPFLRQSSIGKSVMGRDLPLLVWGEGKVRVLLCGTHHGNEWFTSLLLMRFAEWLCREYQNKNEGILQLYQHARYLIVPMLNPDGAELSLHGLGEEISPVLREHLLRANNGSEDFNGKWQANANGVDLNHNYNAAFERGRAFAMRMGITEAAPTRYCGTHPESEPESAALAQLTRSILPNVCVAYHSQGEVIYADFEGEASKRALRIAEEMSRLSGYELDRTQGIASCSGFKDWVIHELYLPAFTIEIGHGCNPLPLSQFEEIWKKNIELLLFLGKCDEISS